MRLVLNMRYFLYDASTTSIFKGSNLKAYLCLDYPSMMSIILIKFSIVFFYEGLMMILLVLDYPSRMLIIFIKFSIFFL